MKLPALRFHRTDIAYLSGEAIVGAGIVAGVVSDRDVAHGINSFFRHDIAAPIAGAATWVTLIGSKVLRVLTNPARMVPPGSAPEQHVLVTPPAVGRPLLFPEQSAAPTASTAPASAAAPVKGVPVFPQASVVIPAAPQVVVPTIAPTIAPAPTAALHPVLSALFAAAVQERPAPMPATPTLQGQLADAIIAAAETNKQVVIDAIQSAEGSVAGFIATALTNLQPTGTILPLIWGAIKPAVVGELLAVEAANPGSVIFTMLDIEARKFAASLGG